MYHVNVLTNKLDKKFRLFYGHVISWHHGESPDHRTKLSCDGCHGTHALEVFVNNTNLTFLYKIVKKNSTKNKVASCWN